MRYNFKQMTDTAKLPTRHTPVSAGVDFYSDEDVVLDPFDSMIVSTGISWNPEMNEHVDMQDDHMDFNPFPDCSIALIIQSRSGYAFKHEIEASNAGVIDQDYVPHGKEKAIIKVKLYNHGTKHFHVKSGDKICQGVPQLIPFFEDVMTLDTHRSGKGFGSSDAKEK